MISIKVSSPTTEFSFCSRKYRVLNTRQGKEAAGVYSKENFPRIIALKRVVRLIA
jgi:hypothetical protein